MISIEEVWRRISLYEGSEFRQKRGKAFVYKMNGKSLVPNTTNISITKSEIDVKLQISPNYRRYGE